MRLALNIRLIFVNHKMIITDALLYKPMSWFHLVFGLVVFIVFAVTGSHMRADFPDKEIIPQELRLLMRSRHIYILFSALIHLTLGLYLRINPGKWLRSMQ